MEMSVCTFVYMFIILNELVQCRKLPNMDSTDVTYKCGMSRELQELAKQIGDARVKCDK